MPDPATEVSVPTRPFCIVVLEGALYFVIAALTPVVTVLDSDKLLDPRSITAMCLTSLIAGAVALKAFFSQSYSNSK